MADDRQGDAELMSAFAGGDYDAFGVLVGRHRDTVVRFCRHLLGDAEAAEDAAQEAFLALFRYRERYAPQAPLPVLLYRLARNASLDIARRRRGTAGDQPAEATDPAPGAPERVEAQALGHSVRAALARLTPRQREVLVLAHYQGLTYTEIAQSLGVPAGTVASRAASGYRALRRLLEGGEDGALR